MKKTKKEIYKDLLNNLVRTNSISKSTKNILSEKGGRLICDRLEKKGFLNFRYNHQNHKIPTLTPKGQELLNNLNDFNFQFKEGEVFK